MNPRFRLLIVDDDLDMLRNLALMLSLEGFYVMTASSGMAASVLLAEHSYDAIITDLRMPIIDGYEIIRRAQTLHPQAMCLVTSRYIDEKASAWMLENGIHGLEKPYNIHKLSALLHDFQRRRYKAG